MFSWLMCFSRYLEDWFRLILSFPSYSLYYFFQNKARPRFHFEKRNYIVRKVREEETKKEGTKPKEFSNLTFKLEENQDC